ncbi:MAG: four helix bundle protein [Vicinamibacterales bacterium]
MGHGFKHFTDIRAWRAAVTFKRAVYDACRRGRFPYDLRDQLERAASAPPAHIAEGFGRFGPPDFARFVVMARASLMESQNHLIDLRDRGQISEVALKQLDGLAVAALREATGLIKYLQSPEALGNAKQARRITRTRNPEHEPGSRNPEQ